MPSDGRLSAWLARAAQTHPDRTALATGEVVFSYGELYAHTSRLASAVAVRGLAPAVPFAVISANGLTVALSLYLALHTSTPVLPLSPRRPDLYRLLSQCNIHCAFVDTNIEVPVPMQMLPTVWLERTWDVTPTGPVNATAETIQLVVPTTGSTGAARAVMLSGANLVAAAHASRSRLALQPGDAWLDCMPLSHIAGLSVLLRCLESGATVVLHDGFTPSAVWSDLQSRRITHISLVPAMLHELLEHSRGHSPPVSLRAALVGGGPLSEELLQRARGQGWPVCPTYGLSETSSQVATLCPAGPTLHSGDTGPPLPGIRVQIIDTLGKPTQGLGTIRISGPTVMAGYANPQWSPGDGLSAGGFTTSDLGHIDARGHLHVRGRTDNLIVSGGENVSPEHVEALIGAHPDVEEVGITGMPDATWGERIVALFSGNLEEGVLATWCRAHIPSALRPRVFLRLDALPRNALGKLDRPALRQRAAKLRL